MPKVDFEEERNAIDYVTQAMLSTPLLHFRRPLADGSLETRWIADGDPPWKLIEHDARRVLCGLFRLVARHAL